MADSNQDDVVPGDGEEFISSNQFERDDAPQDEPSEEAFSGDDLNTEDLEAAYLRALEAMETEEWGIDESDESEAFEVASALGQSPLEPIEHTVPIDAGAASQTDSDFSEDLRNSPPAEEIVVPAATDWRPIESATEETEIAEVDFLNGPGIAVPVAHANPVPSTNAFASGGKLSGSISAPSLSSGSSRATDAAPPPPNATRIIEACLFVGGQPLSAKRLATLLETTGEPSYLERLIDELNLEYASQQRPYEIRLGDGGYRMALRTGFEAVRNRVYGVGPRDVKLSQDVLEVLALVAYQQPITHAGVEASGKMNVANILRQLLRRELITLTRTDQTRNGVEYRTSARFLQLFGLGNLNELPRPEDLAMR